METQFVIYGDYGLLEVRANPDAPPEVGYGDGAVIVATSEGKELERLFVDEKSLRPLAEALMMAALMAERSAE